MWGFIREKTLRDFLQRLGGNDKTGFKNVRKTALFFILLNFCLLSVTFLHAVALSRRTIKLWSQVTIAIGKCVDYNTQRQNASH